MKTFVAAVMVAFLAGGLACGQVVVIDDNFGDGDPETNTDGTVAAGLDGSYFVVSADGGVETPGTGIPELAEPGPLRFDPSANGNWARAEFISNNDFSFPEAGQSRTFSWTIGPVTPTSDVPGDDYRIQLNATNALRTQDTAGDGVGRGSERWLLDGTVSGASAISLDLYFEKDNITGENGVLLAQLWEKDSTFPERSNGEQVPTEDGDLNFNIGDGGNGAGNPWRFWEDSNTFSLTLTDTGYTWSDSVTGFESSIGYTDQTIADFADGYWAYTHGQNRDGGRGFHEMSRFTVTETGFPVAGLLCDFDADGDCDQQDINELYANGTDADGIGDWLSQASDPANTALDSPTDQLVVGDLNLSGEVDSTDLGLLLNNFGGTDGAATTWLGGDLDASGGVTSSDLGLLLNNFGFASAAVAAVPEPNAAILSGFAMLVMALAIRRRR